MKLNFTPKTARIAVAIILLAQSQQSLSEPYLTGIRDSTGVVNIGSAHLQWEAGQFHSCNAPARSCGSSTGIEIRDVLCKAYHLNNENTVATVERSYCQTVTSIGEMPAEEQSCSRFWGACPPPPPPTPPDTDTGNNTNTTEPSSSSSSSCDGYTGTSALICGTYVDDLGREPSADEVLLWDSVSGQNGWSEDEITQNIADGARNDDCSGGIASGGDGRYCG